MTRPGCWVLSAAYISVMLAGRLDGQTRSGAGAHPAPSTQHPAQNVILVVLDGVRWQEVFRGADCSFIEDTAKGHVSDTAGFRRRFCRATPDSARAALMPWLWGTLVQQGVLFGDRDEGGDAHISNTMKFSYPGYNEILTGAFDPRIDKNAYGPNPNVTVLEWLGRRPGFRGRVRAWGTWNVFDDIFNEPRAGFPVRSGWEVPFPGPRDAVERELDALYATMTRHWDYMPPDALLQRSVLQSLRVDRPRVLYVGFGEPDEWAHDERYDNYAISLNAADGYLRELWSWVGRTPGYAGRTTLIVLCDHGRGRTHRDWSDHGREVEGAEEIWMGAVGPGVPSLGVVRTGVLIQAQVAATVARVVGEDWHGFNAAAAPAVEFETFRR